jgi:5-methylcytosine-specific restriction endonuclease McrA
MLNLGMRYTPKERRHRAAGERARWQFRQELGRFLLGGLCAYCEEAEEDLEFDHIDPKTKRFAVSEGMPAMKRWLRELKKCQLLCVDCHKQKSDEEETSERDHGTWAAYQRAGCRCKKCKALFNQYRRGWRERAA